MEYLDVETDPAFCEGIFAELSPKRRISKLPEKYRAKIREEEKLMDLLRRAHAEHERAGVAG